MRDFIINTYLEGTDDINKVLFADGFDQAIIGYEPTLKKIIYSEELIINILTEDMSEEDAIEHFYYNIKGSYLGPHTPIFFSSEIDE